MAIEAGAQRVSVDLAVDHPRTLWPRAAQGRLAIMSPDIRSVRPIGPALFAVHRGYCVSSWSTGALLAISSDAKNSRPQDGHEHRSRYSRSTLLIHCFGHRFSVLNYDSLQKQTTFSVQIERCWRLIIVATRSVIGRWEFRGRALPEASGGTIGVDCFWCRWSLCRKQPVMYLDN